MKLIFLHADKHQSFNTLGIKVFYKLILSLLMGKIKHSQITHSNKFAIFLQYLKKEVISMSQERHGVHFWHADKRQNFHKLVLSFLMEVARHFQNTQNRKLVIFLQYIKKNCPNCFVFYCDAKHSDILLRGSSHVRCYLLFCKILVYGKNPSAGNSRGFITIS